MISGLGQLIIDGVVENSSGTAITQGSITVNSGNSLTANAGDITTVEGITNEGTLTFNDENGTNSNLISGNGQLIIDGLVNNYIGTTISQSSITVNNGKSFTANASDITTEEGIANEGTLTYTGGVNTSTITMTGSSGILKIENNL